MLLEFWDFCGQLDAHTALPEGVARSLRAGDRRGGGGAAREDEPRRGTRARPGGRLTVVGIHSPGFPPGRGRRGGRSRGRAPGDRVPGAARRRVRDVARVRERGLAGPLPVRRPRQAVRVPLRGGRLHENGARDPGAPRRRARARGTLRAEDVPGGRCGCRARINPVPTPVPTGGGRMGRARGRGTSGREPTQAPRTVARRTSERVLSVSQPGAYRLFQHDRHTAAVLELELSAGVICHATCFTPGWVSGRDCVSGLTRAAASVCASGRSPTASTTAPCEARSRRRPRRRAFRGVDAAAVADRRAERGQP